MGLETSFDAVTTLHFFKINFYLALVVTINGVALNSRNNWVEIKLEDFWGVAPSLDCVAGKLVAGIFARRNFKTQTQTQNVYCCKPLQE